MLHEVSKNLELWNGWADLHMAGAYDVEGFIADPCKRPFDWVIQEVVGDVAGKRLLHLQCHVGLDTMRFGLAGATNLTGVDFSPKAIAAARSIADRLGVSATFIEADVAALPESVPVSAFDVVFTSYGTIMWLPDLKPWAEGIASRLAPGGVFHIIDAHPFLTVFDDFAPEPPLKVRYPYFSGEPLYFEEHGSYADREADFVADSYAGSIRYRRSSASFSAKGWSCSRCGSSRSCPGRRSSSSFRTVRGCGGCRRERGTSP